MQSPLFTFLMVLPADVLVPNVHDWRLEPLQSLAVKPGVPPGWRHNPLALLTSRKVPFPMDE